MQKGRKELRCTFKRLWKAALKVDSWSICYDTAIVQVDFDSAKFAFPIIDFYVIPNSVLSNRPRTSFAIDYNIDSLHLNKDSCISLVPNPVNVYSAFADKRFTYQIDRETELVISVG